MGPYMRWFFLFCCLPWISAATPPREDFLNPYDRDRLSPGSLNRFVSSIYSQHGEDGIIEEIFKRLGIAKGFFIEFGASDGVWISNTRLLWEQGWSGAMIEADGEWFRKLEANYVGVENVIRIHETVVDEETAAGGLTFDAIADRYFPDEEIDFLSIDIDGLDYLILKSLKRRPKVICIEANLGWHPLFDQEVPKEVAFQNLQQPLPVMIGIAESLGYVPVCMTINLFLIRKDLYQPFAECPSDPFTLWRDGFRSCRDEDKRYVVSRRAHDAAILANEDPSLQRDFPITFDF